MIFDTETTRDKAELGDEKGRTEQVSYRNDVNWFLSRYIRSEALCSITCSAVIDRCIVGVHGHCFQNALFAAGSHHLKSRLQSFLESRVIPIHVRHHKLEAASRVLAVPEHCDVVGVLLLTGKTRADVIQQWPSLMAANQGEAAELSCFQTDGSKNVMLWYRQDADEGLRLMGYSINGIAATYEKNFENKINILRPELKKSILRILTVKVADSAVYYCASSEHRAEDCVGANTKTSPVNNWGCGCRADLVHQSPRSSAIKERGSAEMECLQEGEFRDTMFWYRQPAGGGFLLMGYLYLAGRCRVDPKIYHIVNTMKTMQKEDEERIIVSGSYDYTFGDGSKLVVLEHPVKNATVTLFEPSPKEIKEKKKATVVCLVSDFYPDNLKIFWSVNGEEMQADTKSIQTDLNSISMDGNKSYSITSRLRFNVHDWVKIRTITCKVDHYAEGSTKSTQHDTLTVNAEICGVTKASKLQSMGTGKLTYLILICKSIFYGIFVSIIAWKTKTSYNKRFD
ncbi:M1-specific T cell receptor beta chain-like [Scyliorhinus canicula]|uniref:M1-specific T cell receptor beta chain-like n=1 Tax=Scyliorhinus canicula TaxID=7830 RepID=UPI0018F28757|nr:M1-specific T cell receptor beta chain-like [Scyliorhinus canicula]